MAINERIENALNIVESEVARIHGFESPVTRSVFEATELIRADLTDGFVEVSKEEKKSWTIEELASLSDEEREKIIKKLPEEELDKLIEKFCEKDPLNAFIALFITSLIDE